MFSTCDACRRPGPAEVTQIQIERGEVVTTKNGSTLRPRARDLLILCESCGAQAVAAIRRIIDAGGVGGTGVGSDSAVAGPR